MRRTNPQFILGDKTPKSKSFFKSYLWFKKRFFLFDEIYNKLLIYSILSFIQSVNQNNFHFLLFQSTFEGSPL